MSSKSPRWLECGKHILSLTGGIRSLGKYCGRPEGHDGACFPVPLDVDRGPAGVTDEEMSAMLARSGNYAGGICMAAQKYHSDVPRLIAEVERLR